MAPPRRVTPPDPDLLALIAQMTRDRGEPPSIRDVGAAIGLASPGAMHRHVLRLRRAGLVAAEGPLCLTEEALAMVAILTGCGPTPA